MESEESDDEFFDAMSRMSETTMTNRRGSDVTFHSIYASDEFSDSPDGSAEAPPEIANLIIGIGFLSPSTKALSQIHHLWTNFH